MRFLLSLSLSLTALVVLVPIASGCSSTSDDSEQTNASEINQQQQPPVDQGVIVGPEGGGVRDAHGVFSVVIPQGALAEEARVIVARDPNGVGAQGTPLYRVTINPPEVTLKYPVQLFLDLEKERAGFGETLKDPIDLRLASAADAESAQPTTPLTKVVRKDLKNGQFIGATKDLGRSFGLIEAKKIDCDGTSCSNCCLVATSRLTCSPACSFDAGELTVDCLKDSDCGGGGLKCCTPNTVRGGGVLRVDDNRITCKADCGGENLHVCDMSDPNRCSDCAPAVTGCKRGFCGHTSKTPTQLICPY
jgi:hypothetical protein